jgi:hypothetical protein
MHASYWLSSPEKVEATLTVTMRIEEWRELMRQLPAGYPAWKFSEEIANLIAHANRHFTKMPSPEGKSGAA